MLRCWFRLFVSSHGQSRRINLPTHVTGLKFWFLTRQSRFIFFVNIGSFTRDDTTGRSAVDYAIGSPKILKSVDHFEVSSKFPESDHRPVSLSLTCNKSTFKNVTRYDNEWESEILLNSLLQCMTNLCDMNIVAAKLDNYVSQACKRAFKFGSCSRRKMKYTLVW